MTGKIAKPATKLVALAVIPDGHADFVFLPLGCNATLRCFEASPYRSMSQQACSRSLHDFLSTALGSAGKWSRTLEPWLGATPEAKTPTSRVIPHSIFQTAEPTVEHTCPLGQSISTLGQHQHVLEIATCGRWQPLQRLVDYLQNQSRGGVKWLEGLK